MEELDPIRSSSNALLKRFRAAATGREAGSVLLEGRRLVDDAVRAGVRVEVCLVPESRAEQAVSLVGDGVSVRAVADTLFEKLGSVKTTPEVLALAPTPRDYELDEVATDGAFLCVASELQDPGNLGALARSAEAAGATALIVTGCGCKPWQPKALRGSMGSLLRLPICTYEDSGALARELKARDFRQVSADTRDGESPARFDWRGSLALWLTGETGRGLPAGRFEGVTIPMQGEVESLNVTAAAAVLLFQAAEGRRAT